MCYALALSTRPLGRNAGGEEVERGSTVKAGYEQFNIVQSNDNLID